MSGIVWRWFTAKTISEKDINYINFQSPINISTKLPEMPVSEIVAPALSTYQDEEVFSYAKVDKKELKRSHLQGTPGLDYLQQLYQYYDLDELVSILSEQVVDENGTLVPKFKRVTFQFPDSLVCDSAAVTQEIQKRLGLKQEAVAENESNTSENCCSSQCNNAQASSCCGKKEPQVGGDQKQRIWILADTSYSSCCVDEVAAEHVNADLLVHFGDSCLNPAALIQSVYVFGKPSLDLDVLALEFRNRYPILEFKDSRIALMADAPHTYLLRGLSEKLPEYSLVVAELEVKDKNARVVGYQPAELQDGDLRALNRIFKGLEPADAEDQTDDSALTEVDLFHISQPEAPRLLQLTTKFQSVTMFDPASNRISQGPFPNLMRRYKFMHMARAAGTIGILVNTLSLANTKTLVDGISKKIKEEGKKHYVFVVGKPNVAKLANFDAIDMWCILGCDHQGIILDQTSEYFKPIVTPYELLLALSDELTWTGQWVTDFNRILSELGEESEETNDQSGNDDKDGDNDDDEDDEPQFDAVTGQYVSNARPLRRLKHLQITLEAESEEADESGALVKKLSSAVAVRGTISTSAAHLQTREWTGLGSDWQDHGNSDNEGAEVEQGRSGVARGYDFDRENRNT